MSLEHELQAELHEARITSHRKELCVAAVGYSNASQVCSSPPGSSPSAPPGAAIAPNHRCDVHRHLALGFAAKRVTPGVSLAVLLLAAQFADVLWPSPLGSSGGRHLDIISQRHHDDDMRTTLTLERDVAARLKGEMRRSGKTLKAVVNEALRVGLGLAGRRVRPPRFTVRPHAFGFKPGVDLDRLNQLADELEAEETARTLRR